MFYDIKLQTLIGTFYTMALSMKHVTNLQKIFLEMIKECIPSKQITVRPDDKPWYDHEIRHFSLDEACDKFTKIFLEMIKECIPSKQITVRPDDKPWYDHEIRHFSSKRDRVKRKLIKSNSAILKEQYKRLRNKVNNLKKTC